MHGFFRALSRLIGLLVGAAILGLVVLDMLVPSNPFTGRAKGIAFKLLWDRQPPLVCDANMEMFLRGDALDLPRGPLLQARGRCKLHLLGVRLRGPRVLAASEDAQVFVEGGHLEGKDGALEVSDRAVVYLKGAEVIGPVQRSGAGRVEAEPEAPRPRADAPAAAAPSATSPEAAAPAPRAKKGKKKRH